MPFRKGVSGNPSGRKKGDRLKPAEFAKSLRTELQAESRAILAKAIELAKGGDVGLIKFLLERLIAPIPYENTEVQEWPDIQVNFVHPETAVETPPAQPARVFKVPEFRGINQ